MIMHSSILLSIMTGMALVWSGCGGTGASLETKEETKIVVSTVNTAPIATFDSLSINRDVSYTGRLTAVDADDDALEYILTKPCAYGTISVDKNGYFTYVPNPGYKGKDSFSYQVKDELSTCPQKQVTIDVIEKEVTKPSAPSHLGLEALSTCKIRVSWRDNADDELGFDIYRDGVLAAVADANSQTVDLCDGLKPATTYEIAVRAKNIAGHSEAIVGQVTTQDITTPPLKPSNLHVVAVDQESVRLAWKDNADNESAYDIYVNGVWKKEISSNCNCTVVTGLAPNTTYTFQVKAKNKIGTSESEVISATTKPLPNKAPQITLFGDKKVTLIVGDVFVDAGASASDPEDGNLTVTTISDLNTSKEGSYQIRYSATDSAGDSAEVLRDVAVLPASFLNAKVHIPFDSNLELGGEEGILYYVDPRPEENGLNRALRIDYLAMIFSDINVSGINPHSIDRAGDSDKFYVRTQNSFSFDVVNFKENSVKTVDMGEHQPRAIGASNTKYNLQLISVRNRQVVDVIDTNTDTIIASLGDETDTPGITTGHAFWLDEDHFALIDRAKPQVVVFKVIDQGGVLSLQETDRSDTATALHAIERVANPITRKDLVSFYGNGEGNIAKGGTILPFMLEMTFYPETGKLVQERTTELTQSTAVVKGRPPITHHTGITPDGKFIYAPVYDGKVYIIDRASMKVVKVVEAALGAGHVEFSKSLGLAIITNHWDNEVTVIDLETQTVKARVIISTTQEYHEEEPHLLQPHFSYLSEDGKYYYTFATQDGDFLKINLETFEIEEKLHTGGAPEQAHS